MSFPSKNDILIGISFVFVGIIYTLCDKWQVAVNFVGTERPHLFDHLFLMWFLKQLLQLTLLVIWMAIDKNWVGCAYFRHGDIVQRANPRLKMLPRFNANNALNINDGENVHDTEEIHDGNGHLPDEPDSDNDVNIAAPDLNDQTDDNDADNDDGQENRELIQLPDEQQPRKTRKNKQPSLLIYLLPALFAQAHVLLLYFGLKLTYGSSFMMLKGTVTFFTALLSMAFLAQQLACYIWFGVVVATLGFAVSGISDYVHNPSGGFEKYGIAAGNLLIVMAQIMFATKIIYEEKFIRKHSIHPMMFLGCEAIYGIFFAAIFLIAFSFVDAPQYNSLPSERLEDVKDALYQFCHSWRVTLAVLGSLFCYILYTYLGLFLIRDQGALPRIMIETFVWIVFWAVCLFLRWEKFFIAQVPGLCIIAIGALIYSHILVLPFSSRIEGIDNTGGSFRDQFLDLDKPDNQPNLRRNGQREADENILQNGNDAEGQQDQTDDRLLGQEVVVEIHQPEAEDVMQQRNLYRANSTDELLLEA